MDGGGTTSGCTLADIPGTKYGAGAPNRGIQIFSRTSVQYLQPEKREAVSRTVLSPLLFPGAHRDAPHDSQLPAISSRRAGTVAGPTGSSPHVLRSASPRGPRTGRDERGHVPMLPISPRGMWSWQQRGNDSDRPPTPRIVRSFSVQREDASRAAFRGSLPGQQGEEDKLCTVTLDHTPAECSQPWSSAAGKARGASIQADAAASLSENAYKPALYSDRPEAAQRPPAAPRTPPLSQRHATPLDITDALPTPRPCATPPPVAPLGIGLVGVSAPLHRSCPSKPRLLGASALAAPCSPAADPVEPARRRVRTRRALFPPPSGLASPPTTLPDARGDRREAKGWVGAAPPPGEAWSSPKATRSPHCSLSSMSTASAPVSEVRDEGGLGDGPPAPGESTAEDGGEEGRSGGEEASREGGSVAIGRGRSAGAAAGSGKKRRGGRGRGKDGRYKGRRGKGETGGGGDEGGDEGKRKGVRVRGKEKDKERARRRKSAKGRAIGVIDEDALETVCGSASGGSRGGEGHERRGAAEVVEEAGGGGAAGVSGEVLAVQLLETKRVVAAVRGARRQEEEREEKRGAGVDVEMARKQAKERLQRRREREVARKKAEEEEQQAVKAQRFMAYLSPDRAAAQARRRLRKKMKEAERETQEEGGPPEEAAKQAEEAAQEWARAAALRVIQRARELRQRLKEGALAGSCNASRGGRADPHAESRAAEKGGRGGVGEDQKESGKGDLGEVEEMAKEEAEKAAGGKRKRSKGKKERKKGDGVERNSHKERRGRVESMAVAERDKQRALTYAVNAILTVRENAAAAQFQLLVQQWREQGLRPGEVPDSTGEGVKEHAVPEGLQHSV